MARVRTISREDFDWTLRELARGAHLEATDLLSARRYARPAHERDRLLNALIHGYAAHQDRIQDLNDALEQVNRRLNQLEIKLALAAEQEESL